MPSYINTFWIRWRAKFYAPVTVWLFVCLQSEDDVTVLSVTFSVLRNILSCMKSLSVGHQFATTTLPSVLTELLQRVKDKVGVCYTLFMHSLYFQSFISLLYALGDDRIRLVDDDNADPYFTAIFQDNLAKPVPECLHSGFYCSKGWRRWWWQVYWSYKTCRIPVKSSPTYITSRCCLQSLMSSELVIPLSQLVTVGDRSFAAAGPRLWNCLRTLHLCHLYWCSDENWKRICFCDVIRTLYCSLFGSLRPVVLELLLRPP